MSRSDRDPPTPFAELPESDAGALLRKLPEPAPFTAARARRALDGVYDRLAVPPRRRWWPMLLAAPAVAAALVLVMVALRPRPTAPLALAPPVIARAPEAPRVLVLEGAVDAKSDRIVLSEGRVIVQTAGSLAVIEVPGATPGRVTVRARSIVEVRVRQSRVRVSAFEGSAELQWVDLGKREIAAGRAVSTDGEASAIEPARAEEVTRILREGPGVPPARAIEAPVPPAARPPSPPVQVRPAPAVVATHPAPSAGAQAVHVSPPRAPPAPPEASMAAPVAVAVVSPDPPAATIAAAPSLPAPSLPAPSLPAPSLPAPSLPAPKAPSALTVEALSLERAVRALRHDRDPAAALHAVDEHLAAHPRGLLRNEAELTRVDALLQLSRRSEALAGLEKLSLAGLPRSREFTVIRGELRADAGHCKDALRDFSQIADGSDELAERALAGRADCRARSGDDAGARVDLQKYLERFPQGRFAERARAALAK